MELHSLLTPSRQNLKVLHHLTTAVLQPSLFTLSLAREAPAAPSKYALVSPSRHSYIVFPLPEVSFLLSPLQ